jgi:hypothetical protein
VSHRQLGTPTEEAWPGIAMLPEWHDRLPRFPAKPWSKCCLRMHKDALEMDLLGVSDCTPDAFVTKPVLLDPNLASPHGVFAKCFAATADIPPREPDYGRRGSLPSRVRQPPRPKGCRGLVCSGPGGQHRRGCGCGFICTRWKRCSRLRWPGSNGCAAVRHPGCSRNRSRDHAQASQGRSDAWEPHRGRRACDGADSPSRA